VGGDRENPGHATKADVMAPYLEAAAASGRSQVAAIGCAQEFQLVWTGGGYELGPAWSAARRRRCCPWCPRPFVGSVARGPEHPGQGLRRRVQPALDALDRLAQSGHEELHLRVVRGLTDTDFVAPVVEQRLRLAGLLADRGGLADGVGILSSGLCCRLAAGEEGDRVGD
jgi:hypothetical protein